MDAFYVFVGLVGVGLNLLAYFLLTSGRWRAHDVRYQWLNSTGASAMLLSLVGQWNLAAFVVNLSWLMVALMALHRLYRRRA